MSSGANGWLKPIEGDARHIYAKRVLRMDEDSNQMNAGEMYDGRGEMWRIQEIGQAPDFRPAAQTCWTMGGVHYGSSGRSLSGIGHEVGASSQCCYRLGSLDTGLLHTSERASSGSLIQPHVFRKGRALFPPFFCTNRLQISSFGAKFSVITKNALQRPLNV